MNDDQVSCEIERIERGLMHDDPAFVQRMGGRRPAEIERIERGLMDDGPAFVQRIGGRRRADIGTIVILVLLLTVDLATLSWLVWSGELLAPTFTGW